MRDLSTLSALPEFRGSAPWPDHEYVTGWGVFGLPFDSGHVLALRVFPQNSFAPYRTVWHRDPHGAWAIYVDGPRVDSACPRYYGPACDHVGRTTITITWLGPRTLHVTMPEPALDWTLTAASTRTLTALNALAGGLPAWTWRPRPLLRVRERIARALGLGRLELAGPMPSGHVGTLMPRRMYVIDEATATLNGTDLGNPARLDTNPRIGGVPLPARGVLAIGSGVWRIRDRAEFARAQADCDPVPQRSA